MCRTKERRWKNDRTDLQSRSIREIKHKIIAILPNGHFVGEGTVVKKDGRLALDEGNNNIHFLDGGFPDGTTFDYANIADDEEVACAELDGTEQKKQNSRKE